MLRALAMLLVLSACGTPTQAGYAGTSAGWSDAADLGDGRWFISCSVNASACTVRAAQLCAAGFDVEDMNSSQASQAFVSPYGGGIGSRADYQLMVRCR